MHATSVDFDELCKHLEAQNYTEECRDLVFAAKRAYLESRTASPLNPEQRGSGTSVHHNWSLILNSDKTMESHCPYGQYHILSFGSANEHFCIRYHLRAPIAHLQGANSLTWWPKISSQNLLWMMVFSLDSVWDSNGYRQDWFFGHGMPALNFDAGNQWSRPCSIVLV